jgi:DNA-binding MarR family transcriptional regulator
VEAVVQATRFLVAISAQSVAAVDDVVTLATARAGDGVQPRAAEPGRCGRRVGVHPSNATRAVDRMVGAGLLSRSDDPTDRRNLVLELTPAGQALVDQVMTEHPVNPVLDSCFQDSLHARNQHIPAAAADLARVLSRAARHAVRVRFAMFALSHTIIRARVPEPPVGPGSEG